MRRKGNGGTRYYFRSCKGQKNGDGLHAEKWIPLGSNAGQAREEARRLRDDMALVARGERPRQVMGLRGAVDWYISRIQKRGLLAWKDVRGNLMPFADHLGDVPLREITRDDVEGFMATRRQKVRPMTANTSLRDIKRMFSAAFEAEYLDRNPAAKIRSMRAVAVPSRLPSAIEVERLMTAAQPWLRLLILVLVTTGARTSEALRLDWSDIDLTAGTLKLRRRKVSDELELPIAQRLKDALWVESLERGGPTRGPVFAGANGQPMVRELAWRPFKALARRLGWPWLTLRGFRRLVATEVWRRTRDVRAVQKTLGHSNLRMSEIYMQGEDEAKAAGVGAMDAFLSGTLNGGSVTKSVTNAPEAVSGEGVLGKKNEIE